MGEQLINQLCQFRSFSAVAHPAHAHDLLVSRCADDLRAWAGGYAMLDGAHRQLVEELLGALAWGDVGSATLVNGLYGTGKSHLLILLHLLAALPEAWEPFLESYPTFMRYSLPMREKKWLVAHFSLDAYTPQQALEDVIAREVNAACEKAGLPAPFGKGDTPSRHETWGRLTGMCAEHGFKGVMLLVDELSMFLAGKTPSKREADAAFLQFLAGWTHRTPIWLIATLQRHLSDVGALRTHSWRQVEDRFRRHTLSAQEIGRVLHRKLIHLSDPAAVRSAISGQIAPAAQAASVNIAESDFRQWWPFHPSAIPLLVSVVNQHLSPHRSAVEILQEIGKKAWEARPANRLITPGELLATSFSDLQRLETLREFWRVVGQLRDDADETSNPALARRVIDLLAIAHLAGFRPSISQLASLLFDGENASAMEDISKILRLLRRRNAGLDMLADAEPAHELWWIVCEDGVNVTAFARMRECLSNLASRDARVAEEAMLSFADQSFPLAAAIEGVRIDIPWRGMTRRVMVQALPTITREHIMPAYEGLRAGVADAHILLPWPGMPVEDEEWPAATRLCSPQEGLLALWQPRELLQSEWELWEEYAAWARAGVNTPPDAPQRRAVSRHCEQRTQELSSPVHAILRSALLGGRLLFADGSEASAGNADNLVEALADMLASPFDSLYPLLPEMAPHGNPSRGVTHQLLTQLIAPGEASIPPHSLLGEHIESFLAPLGCVEVSGSVARVLPPRWEALAILLAGLSDEPVGFQEGIAILQRPPLGLSAELAALALWAAVRTGAVQALDGFMQPLPAEALKPAHSDAVAFVSAPIQVSETHRAMILGFAQQLELPDDAHWPLTMCHVERHIRNITAQTLSRIDEIQRMIDEWSDALNVQPWAWRESERLIAALRHLKQLPQITMEALLEVFPDMTQLHAAAQLSEAGKWWQAHGDGVRMLARTPDESEHKTAIAETLRQLSEGERRLPSLPETGDLLREHARALREEYRAWHEGVFGVEVIAALRGVFDGAEFRAIKQLAGLPLPMPPSAGQCLQALSDARLGYCPGDLHHFEREGVCSRCNIRLHEPSPMPIPAEIAIFAREGLREYAQLLKTHEWAGRIRARLEKAPSRIAERVSRLLEWSPETGADMLLADLNEAVIGWLCRDAGKAVNRSFTSLHATLAGRELTRGEARTAFEQWIDPEGGLSDDTLLAIEV